MNRLTKKFIYGLIGLCLAGIIIPGCKSTHKLSQDKAKPIFYKKLMSRIEESYCQFSTYSCKFSADFKDQNTDKSFSGTLVIQRDSAIVVTIGIPVEVIRVSLTQDSIKILNRVSKECYLGTYDFISAKYDVDFEYSILQAMLVNELFAYPNPEDLLDPKHKFGVSIDSNMYVLKSHKTRRIKKNIKKSRTQDFVTQSISVASDIFRIHKMFIREYEANRVLFLDYDNYMNTEKGLFPHKFTMEVKDEEKTINLNMEFSKVNFNSTRTPSFKIPEKYELLQLEYEEE